MTICCTYRFYSFNQKGNKAQINFKAPIYWLLRCVLQIFASYFPGVKPLPGVGIQQLTIEN